MERRIVPFYMAYPLPVNYQDEQEMVRDMDCLLYTSPSPRDDRRSRMPSSA